MLFMSTMTAPSHVNVKLAKKFIEVASEAPPPYLKSLGLYACYGGDGYKWYHIIEIDDDKVDVGMKELLKRSIPLDEIEGVKTTMEPLITVRQGFEAYTETGRL